MLVATAVWSAIGVAVSAELTRIHVLVHTDPSFHSVCAVSEGVNCETVAASPYAVFAGLPVSLWGVLGYGLMGGLALWGVFVGRRGAPRQWGTLWLLAATSVLVSVALGALSLTRIHSLCLFCLASYAISLILWGIAAFAVHRSGSTVWGVTVKDWVWMRSHRRTSGALGLLGVVVLASLYAFVPRYWQTPGWVELPQLATGRDEQGHWWIGAKSPQRTVVEFSDYECPHCRAAHKAIRLMAAKHPEVRLVHRHLPLDVACNAALKGPFHRHACRFAEAAECAGQQGRFWEMNDALFSAQERRRADAVDVMSLAVRLGLDRAAFKACVESHVAAGRVRADLEEGAARALRGTPSYVVGEQTFVGRISEQQFERLLAL